MRLSPKALAIAGAVVWGGYGMLLTGILHLLLPRYGEHFLLTMTSIYPGYHAARYWADVLVGAGYGIVDGAIAGLLIAWTYNLFASP